MNIVKLQSRIGLSVAHFMLLRVLALVFCVLVLGCRAKLSSEKPLIKPEKKGYVELDTCKDWEKRIVGVEVQYLDFNGQKQKGKIYVLNTVSEQVKHIFNELYQVKFYIRGVGGNETSAYNCRTIFGTNNVLSNHSFGTAIDINPAQNPILSFSPTGNTIQVSPREGINYVNRSETRPDKPKRIGMISATDANIIAIFAKHGFTVWGGDWDFPVDYMHFEVPRNIAQLLIYMDSADGQRLFKIYMDYYNKYKQNIITQILTINNFQDAKELLNLYKVDKDKFWSLYNAK